MIEAFPRARPFVPAKLRWRLVDSVVEGPSDFGLPAAEQTTDGGGWWEVEFGDMFAGGRDEHHRALRGLASRARGGLRLNVPFIERAPTGAMVDGFFDDDMGFDDDTAFTEGAMIAHLENAVGLRDDTARIRVTSDHRLRGEDVFSLLRSDALGDEMHLCETVYEVSPGLWEVTIGPMFRQAYPAGTPVNFNDPCCAMRIQDREGGLWPAFDRSWNVRTSVKMVEAF